MPIANRDLDVTEQKRAHTVSIGTKVAPNVTAATMVIGPVPFNSELSAINIVGFGLSGTPTMEFRIARFIPGAGNTLMAPGISCVINEWGTSGPLGVSLPASGSTLIQLLAGDQIWAITGTANTSSNTVTVDYVLRALQDFKAHHGSTNVQ